VTDEEIDQPLGRARAWITLILLALGVALIIWMVERLGLTMTDVRSGFGRVGGWFVLILGLMLARFTLRSNAWLALTTARMPLASAVAATISGDALGNVTPLGLIASEPAKAIYLRHYAPPATTLASLAAENFFYSVSVAIYVIVASALLLGAVAVDSAVHVAGVTALGGMAMVLVAAAWLGWQKPAVASAVLSRVPIAVVGRLAGRVRAFEADAYGAVRHNGRALGTVAVSEAVFHLLSFFECWLAFYLLSGETSLAPAIIFDGFNRVVNIVFKFIPGRIGVEEGGTAVLAGAIGYAATDGFMLAVVRKVRTLVFAAIGLALWVRNSRGRA
jgi:hypothetical protein